MELQINITEEGIELDNGSQYMIISIEDLKKIQQKLNEKTHADRVEENLKKDWNFLGGL